MPTFVAKSHDWVDMSKILTKGEMYVFYIPEVWEAKKIFRHKVTNRAGGGQVSIDISLTDDEVRTLRRAFEKISRSVLSCRRGAEAAKRFFETGTYTT